MGRPLLEAAEVTDEGVQKDGSTDRIDPIKIHSFEGIVDISKSSSGRISMPAEAADNMQRSFAAVNISGSSGRSVAWPPTW